jgi:hypothetical protein
MKTPGILLATWFLVLICGCYDRKGEVDLKAYEAVLTLHDTTDLEYLHFGSHSTDCEKYAIEMYSKYENMDSLLNATFLDTDRVAFYVEPYRFVRVGKDEIRFNTRTPGGIVFEFLDDSVNLSRVDDSNSVKSKYSIPRRIRTGTSFINGTLVFSRTETLVFGNTTINCLVIEYLTEDARFIIWLSPQHFVVKLKTIGKDNNIDVLLLAHKKLFRSAV